MKALIVASTMTHGAAMLKWCHHDPNSWHILCYGDAVRGAFRRALLVRPVGEITDAHAAWVYAELKPHIFGPIEAVPSWINAQHALTELPHET